MRYPSLLAALLALGCASQRVTPDRPERAALPAPSGSHLLVATPGEFTEVCAEDVRRAAAGFEGIRSGGAALPVARVVDAFDEAVAALSFAAGRSSVAANSHPDAAMRDAGRACQQQVSALYTGVSLDRGLYDVLAALDASGEDADSRLFVRKLLEDFRRSGVDRDEETRARVRALNEELTALGIAFGRNIAEDSRQIQVDPSALAGLPEDYVRAHPPGEDGKVTVTTDTPDYLPFMSYSQSASAREALWRVYRQRGHPKNQEVLEALLHRRHALATLLGYPSWAALATEDKMIKTVANAADFIERITRASEQRAKADYEVLLTRARQEDPAVEQVAPWDQGYLQDLIKREQLGFSAQTVRPYFEYQRVKQGIFELTSRMFGITYRRVGDAELWHPDVEAWDVLEGDRLLGRFYLDMHPRADKYKHAALFPLVTGKRGVRYPEAVLMCNFPAPGAEPALMEHGAVVTFLHEFGHLLHRIFAGEVGLTSLGGVQERDFVEAPSQMLEEWAWDLTTLRSFARHHQTGEPIPAETVQKLRRAEELGKGLRVRQQMFYAATSLHLHDRSPEGLDPTALVREMQERYTPFPFVDGTYFQSSFGHLNGYSAIYYTYMWSLVIAKDLFTVFAKDGMLDPAPARRYREAVLAAGGTAEAAELVRRFLGRDYDFAAYERWLNRE